MFSIFDISASAMSAQAQRMNVTASNMANADSVAGPDGEAYRARQAVFESRAASDGIGGVGVRESVFALALEPWGILAPSAVAIGIVRWTGELARGAIGCMLMALGEGRAGLTFNADPKGEVRDE